MAKIKVRRAKNPVKTVVKKQIGKKNIKKKKREQK